MKQLYYFLILIFFFFFAIKLAFQTKLLKNYEYAEQRFTIAFYKLLIVIVLFLIYVLFRKNT